jgi:hypothetical protein
MKKSVILRSALFAGLLVILPFITSSVIYRNPPADDLTGAWKGKVQFRTGEFSEVKDLEFMWVFNAGGTMTESSNYDGAPPVPPAYGIWRKTGENRYEARYEFYWTNIPAALEDITESGGFTPGGYGILLEKITLSLDGMSYRSEIKFDSFDNAGKQIAFGDPAEAEAQRMKF